MGHDLPHLVRATYASAVQSRGDAAAAFEQVVEMMLRRRPLLGEEEARREVGAILAGSPATNEAA
jgi:hypothetical protein